MSTPPGEGKARAREQLHALRMNGAWRADPARFRMLEALAARVDAQPEAVRRLLEARLSAGVTEFIAHVAGTQPPMRKAAARAADAVSPLAELNRALRQARPDTAVQPGREELASARRFRKAWGAQRALHKLELALAHKPAQPGPINSHALLLESLALMRAVSPQYLRHFLVQLETLHWLANAASPAGREPTGGVRKPAALKPAPARRRK